MIQDVNPEYFPEGEPTATFWQQATPGTTYWRCHCPAKALGAQSVKLIGEDLKTKIETDVFGVPEVKGLKYPRQRGPAIWQFPGNPTRGRIMHNMIEHGIRTLVEVDDNYTIPNPGQPGLVQEWKAKQAGEREHTSREVHKDICRFADGIIVSTPWLEKFYKNFNEVFVCPNSVDPEDWPAPTKGDDGILRIGYAYSTSHWYDLELVFDALEWASKQPNIEVIMIGPRLEMSFFNRARYVNIPWADSLEEYRKNLALIDVGLCPIKPGDWANSRSDIKVMEYGMSGAMSIASPTESYKPWFHLNGDAVLFPEDNRPKDWTRIVKEVVNNRDMVPEIAKAAKEYILAERTIDKHIHKWKEALHLEG